MSTPFFISKLKFSYDKYSVEKVSTKIYGPFYFRGITLKMCSNKNNDLFKLSIFRSTRSLLVNWAMKVWNRNISGVQTVSN